MGGRKRAFVILADGSLFEGHSSAPEAYRVGPVLGHIGMTGYQELLSSPALQDAIVALSMPHVGNTGLNAEDDASASPGGRGLQVGALLARELTVTPSSWRSEGALRGGLEAAAALWVEGIQTRALLAHLAAHPLQAGTVVVGEALSPEEALSYARAYGLAEASQAGELRPYPEAPSQAAAGGYLIDLGFSPAGLEAVGAAVGPLAPLELSEGWASLAPRPVYVLGVDPILPPELLGFLEAALAASWPVFVLGTGLTALAQALGVDATLARPAPVSVHSQPWLWASGGAIFHAYQPHASPLPAPALPAGFEPLIISPGGREIAALHDSARRVLGCVLPLVAPVGPPEAAAQLDKLLTLFSQSLKRGVDAEA